MTRTALATTVDDLFKHAFGFDRFFDTLDRNTRAMSATNFPPYNISTDNAKDPSFYTLELAVAGFNRDEISVKVVTEEGIDYLVVEGNKKEEEEKKSETYVVRMLAARNFRRVFTLSDNAHVDGESITLQDGVLRIRVNVVKPEPKKSERVLQIAA
jgi:molecular chaperone IbpA